jgi:hypothetical protein
MQLEEGYKTDRGNGSGTTVGYSVEARSTSKPTLVLGNMIGEKWTRISFSRGEKGVPIPGCWDGSGQLEKLGLFSYESAQAMRWWFLAAAENAFVNDATSIRIPMPSPWRLETRLVRHEVKYQYAVTAVSACEFVDNHLGPPKEAEPPKIKNTFTDEEADLLIYLSTVPADSPSADRPVAITPMMRTVLRDLLQSADTEHAKRQEPEQPAKIPAT